MNVNTWDIPYSPGNRHSDTLIVYICAYITSYILKINDTRHENSLSILLSGQKHHRLSIHFWFFFCQHQLTVSQNLPSWSVLVSLQEGGLLRYTMIVINVHLMNISKVKANRAASRRGNCLPALSWKIYLLPADTSSNLNKPKLLVFKVICGICLKKLYFYFYLEGKSHKYCKPYNYQSRCMRKFLSS